MPVRRVGDVDIPVAQPRRHVRDRYPMRQQRADECVPQAVRHEPLLDAGLSGIADERLAVAAVGGELADTPDLSPLALIFSDMPRISIEVRTRPR